MTVVASFDLPAAPVAIELAGPYVFTVLENGTLLRFLAKGAETELLSSHSAGADPAHLVVTRDGRTVLVVQRATDEVDAFGF